MFENCSKKYSSSMNHIKCYWGWISRNSYGVCFDTVVLAGSPNALIAGKMKEKVRVVALDMWGHGLTYTREIATCQLRHGA